MRVRTLYFARLRELTGRESEELEVPESAVCIDVVRELIRAHGARLAAYVLDENGELRRSFALAINGRKVGPNEPVREGDTVVIIPPISGG
ncbi:MAG: MoaD/ThiS family protein [Thaumarchaeota archaeon]|nr:MoaD/ThiS family protein [Candidatus Calditenuaceae archaeon]MDW8042019.1 MoaD/ThiS family protein [Nitrososphaerota archaeon]